MSTAALLGLALRGGGATSRRRRPAARGRRYRCPERSLRGLGKARRGIRVDTMWRVAHVSSTWGLEVGSALVTVKYYSC